MTEDNVGFVYCFSNECMPGIVKIGMTDRCVLQRLYEANRSETWKPPIDYKIEYVKRVSNALKKEKLLHKKLEQLGYRINDNREFFKISIEEARMHFEEMEGEFVNIEVPEKIQKVKQKKEIQTDKVKKEPIINTSFKCERCGKDFSLKQHLIQHLKRKKTCMPILSVNAELYILRLEAKEIKDSTVFCNTCHKQFSHRSGLSRHKKICKHASQQTDTSQESSEE